ncbi:hypothetical protein J5N97_000256 [Dioscorea zingiberensis]|uniref:Purine permease 11 n=1 Tax=Dioscorea zingiberensis TaxID=325984 RepID=A0A9D5BSK7_9LILI|nr:hypothetical protein J5N97_000256 [Dioscorea zingiberensis]
MPIMTRNLQWWFKVSIHTCLILAGQTAATLLGRFYYDQGGNRKWLQTLTFSAGFPILYIPLLLTKNSTSLPASCPLPLVKIAVIYIAIGLMTTADSLMYSYGLLYLSVSTYSLVSTTQLAFNAVFSYFINSERFTHLTLNSIVVLTFSAAIIAFQPDSDDPSETPGGKYVLGFILTLAASATYSLILSLMELTFNKVIKSLELSAVLNMQIDLYCSSVPSRSNSRALRFCGVEGLERGHGGVQKRETVLCDDLGLDRHMLAVKIMLDLEQENTTPHYLQL